MRPLFWLICTIGAAVGLPAIKENAGTQVEPVTLPRVELMDTILAQLPIPADLPAPAVQSQARQEHSLTFAQLDQLVSATSQLKEITEKALEATKSEASTAVAAAKAVEERMTKFVADYEDVAPEGYDELKAQVADLSTRLTELEARCQCGKTAGPATASPPAAASYGSTGSAPVVGSGGSTGSAKVAAPPLKKQVTIYTVPNCEACQSWLDGVKDPVTGVRRGGSRQALERAGWELIEQPAAPGSGLCPQWTVCVGDSCTHVSNREWLDDAKLQQIYDRATREPLLGRLRDGERFNDGSGEETFLGKRRRIFDRKG